MKRCLQCDSNYEALLRSCPECEFSPALIDEFDAYSPDLARAGGGYNSDFYLELVNLEDSNFWFRSRNELIMWALQRYARGFHSLLEIGCGTGYVLSGISKRFPEAKLVASEIFVSGLGFAASRVASAEFLQMDARDIPFAEEFDSVGIFDVLEHIEEDEAVLKQIHHALNAHGTLLLTVPQHDWLWSAKDEHACHVRRYSANELNRKIVAAGFDIVRTTSFVTTLLPAMLLSRWRQKSVSDEDEDVLAELRLPSWLNSMFEGFLYAERMLIAKGVDLPVGGSRLVVARKNDP